jgi:RNA-directed DNA polymerase
MTVNGPEDVALDWDATNWRNHEDNVRRLRGRISTATKDAHLNRPTGLTRKPT